MSKQKKQHILLPCIKSPWNTSDNLIWLGSTLSLHRNLEKLPFPNKLPSDKQKQIISILTRALFAENSLNQPQSFQSDELSSIQKEFLIEHFLSHQPLHQVSAEEAFVLDESGEFLATLNVGDHLILNCIETNEELEEAWNRLIKIELNLSKSINFAFSTKFGFLTSDPAQCGTAFIGTVFLHLPALIYTHSLEKFIKKNKEGNIEQTGLQGHPNEIIGDIVAFHNRYTLGVTEENILSSLRATAMKLVAEEKSIRQQFLKSNESEVAEIKDKVSRAYAILLHSYQIEAVEALHALSLVKMGHDLGWVKGSSQKVFNQLFFTCRRAHLLCHCDQKFSHEELPHRRAEFIHQTLHGLELLI